MRSCPNIHQRLIEADDQLAWSPMGMALVKGHSTPRKLVLYKYNTHPLLKLIRKQ